jgi:hypothetical protein
MYKLQKAFFFIFNTIFFLIHRQANHFSIIPLVYLFKLPNQAENKKI